MTELSVVHRTRLAATEPYSFGPRRRDIHRPRDPRVLGRPDDVPLKMRQFEMIAREMYGDPPPSPMQLRQRYGPWVGWWAYLSRTAAGWLPERALSPA